MPTLIVTLGPPGAGKTTDVDTWHNADRARRRRISRDTLRGELGVGGNHDTNPPDVTSRIVADQQARVVEWLTDGHDVAVDDTCQHQPTMDAWARIATERGAELIVWDYRTTPLEVCIAWDAARAAAGGRHVGDEAIQRVAARCAEVTVPDWAKVVHTARR